jgi:hypothetical protein
MLVNNVMMVIQTMEMAVIIVVKMNQICVLQLHDSNPLNLLGLVMMAIILQKMILIEMIVFVDECQKITVGMELNKLQMTMAKMNSVMVNHE